MFISNIITVYLLVHFIIHVSLAYVTIYFIIAMNFNSAVLDII